MKLYDKKFLIYGNCMIRSFGQPGLSSKGKSKSPYIETVVLSEFVRAKRWLWGSDSLE